MTKRKYAKDPQWQNQSSKACITVRLKLQQPRWAHVVAQAKARNITVDEYLSEWLDAALADQRTKLREEPCYASTAALAAEMIYK